MLSSLSQWPLSIATYLSSCCCDCFEPSLDSKSVRCPDRVVYDTTDVSKQRTSTLKLLIKWFAEA